MMLIRRFNLKEIKLFQRSFAANEVDVRDYGIDEDTRVHVR
jgi:hypothetical protein